MNIPNQPVPANPGDELMLIDDGMALPAEVTDELSDGGGDDDG